LDDRCYYIGDIMAIEIIGANVGPTEAEAKQRASDVLGNIGAVKWKPSVDPNDPYGTFDDGWEWGGFRDKFCKGLTDCVSPDTECAIAKQYPVDMGADDACRPCVKLIRKTKLDSAKAGVAKMAEVETVMIKIRDAE
jgi:hypothetical protein